MLTICHHITDTLVKDVKTFLSAGPVSAHKRKTNASGDTLAPGFNQEEEEIHTLGNKRTRLSAVVEAKQQYQKEKEPKLERRETDSAQMQHQMREKLSKQQQAEVLERWRAKQRAKQAPQAREKALANTLRHPMATLPGLQQQDSILIREHHHNQLETRGVVTRESKKADRREAEEGQAHTTTKKVCSRPLGQMERRTFNLLPIPGARVTTTTTKQLKRPTSRHSSPKQI